jgi:hypothetical protein
MFPNQLAHREKDNCPEKVADDWSGGNEKSIGPLVRLAFDGGPLLVGREELSIPDEPR